jgi:hypothetical protein
VRLAYGAAQNQSGENVSGFGTNVQSYSQWTQGFGNGFDGEMQLDHQKLPQLPPASPVVNHFTSFQGKNSSNSHYTQL